MGALIWGRQPARRFTVASFKPRELVQDWLYLGGETVVEMPWRACSLGVAVFAQESENLRAHLLTHLCRHRRPGESEF